jgi:hypothetical protein
LREDKHNLIKKINMAQQDTQKIIVNQSMMKFTSDYLKQINLNLPLKDVIAITNVLSDYCVNGYSKELGSRLEAIDKFIKQKFEVNE